jgi:mono/diheme cytochrome c family protein
MSFIPRLLKASFLIASAAVGFVLLLVYLGVFNVAADVPHSAFVSTVIKLVRDRSIAVRIKDVRVPLLNDAKLVADGAEHYAAMCAVCHLAPGGSPSEMREGLYPQPPNLAKGGDAVPARQFWVIKHGIKMSAMPAWGKTHDDRSIWAIVAFVQRLPQLTPDQYRALAEPRGDPDGHDHRRGAADEHGGEGSHGHGRDDAGPR